MEWFSKYVRESARWILRNPILLVLVIALVAYNQLSGTDEFLRSVDWLRAEAVLTAAETFVSSYANGVGILSLFFAFLIASFVSLFTIGVNFAVFAQRKGRLMIGIRKAFSRATLELTVFQFVVSILSGAAFYGLALLVVRVLGLAGLDGSIVLFVLAVIGYPLVFMCMATMSMILASEVSLYGKWHLVRTATRWSNLKKLVVFYVSRLGIETIFLGSALFVSAYAQLSVVWATLLITALVAVPFALVRTSGFLLKFKIFENDIWFRSYFRKYYEARDA